MCRYRVKVRGTVYLWGSEGITVNLPWPMLLTIQVDEFGEMITFGTETTSQGGRKTFGTLQPGETYTIPLLNLRGVFAHCDLDTQVSCRLFSPNVAPQSALLSERRGPDEDLPTR